MVLGRSLWVTPSTSTPLFRGIRLRGTSLAEDEDGTAVLAEAARRSLHLLHADTRGGPRRSSRVEGEMDGWRKTPILTSSTQLACQLIEDI